MPRFTFFARGDARELLAIRGSGSTASCLDLGRALAIRRTREPPQSQRLRTQTQGHTVLALVMTCAGQALQEGPLACRGCSPERRHSRESRPKPLRLGDSGARALEMAKARRAGLPLELASLATSGLESGFTFEAQLQLRRVLPSGSGLLPFCVGESRG